MTVAVVLCGGVFGAVSGPSAGTAAAQQLAPPPPEDTLGAADFAWTLRTVEGAPVELADYRGRVLFINLWATWCAPCVAELGSIERLRNDLRSAGLGPEDVVFLMVSPEEPEAVRRFTRRYDFELPFLLELEEIPEAFGALALPTTWIVDRSGRIVLRRRGAAAWDRPEVVKLLREMGSPQRE